MQTNIDKYAEKLKGKVTETGEMLETCDILKRVTKDVMDTLSMHELMVYEVLAILDRCAEEAVIRSKVKHRDSPKLPKDKTHEQLKENLKSVFSELMDEHWRELSKSYPSTSQN